MEIGERGEVPKAKETPEMGVPSRRWREMRLSSTLHCRSAGSSGEVDGRKRTATEIFSMDGWGMGGRERGGIFEFGFGVGKPPGERWTKEWRGRFQAASRWG